MCVFFFKFCFLSLHHHHSRLHHVISLMLSIYYRETFKKNGGDFHPFALALLWRKEKQSINMCVYVCVCIFERVPFLCWAMLVT
jgi:hypothetical protein